MQLKYFFGTHGVAMLASGQMAVPSKIRKVLDDNNVVLSTGFDKCIFGFSVSGWEKIVESGFNQPVFDSGGRLVRRQFFSAADIVDLDSQGRFSVPVELRKYADLSGNVVVIGAGDHFEIWSPKEWDKIKDQVSGNPVP